MKIKFKDGTEKEMDVLTNTDLTGADLTNADLRYAELTDAKGIFIFNFGIKLQLVNEKGD